jgi:parafibromin
MKSLEGPGSLASRTTILLHGASSYFDRTQRQSNLLTALSPSPSLGSRTRPRLGVAPWHRRHSHDSILSVSSSVRNLLMGKTPIATPVHERHYIGPDGKSYPTGIYEGQKITEYKAHTLISVQLASSDPQEPTFLPSVSTFSTSISGSERWLEVPPEAHANKIVWDKAKHAKTQTHAKHYSR